ncbi:MAG TPA: ribonuclease H-like domain-containing protein, partial [Bryobacteraceae bacterium]|nr:ribonuclease H-like domain-containing protein [Bryobacteraceae bacterium]
MDIQEQLAYLRRRIARVDAKYANAVPAGAAAAPALRREPNPVRYNVEQWLSGREVHTSAGCHFESERIWERHRLHGSFEVSVLEEMAEDLFDAISESTVPPAPCTRWAFLDTETTGLAGGSGTYAFLVGVGRITRDGFRLRQFFMRELCEEASLLHALAEHLAEFDVLVTYNGRTYDQPLLETRYRMARARPPFARLPHVDLLAGARRLWKLRFDSCRLVELENQIFGLERDGDLPGEMIPYVYFDYLRTKEAFRVAPILHHNANDILTLACLTAIVPLAFRNPASAPLSHAAEMIGLARWLHRAERFAAALALYRRAIEKGVRDDLLFRTLWDVACLERKLGNETAAVEVYTELATNRNPFRVAALEELAKHYEHRERNAAMALEWTLAALEHEDTPELRRRRERLERRLAKTAKTKRLLL